MAKEPQKLSTHSPDPDPKKHTREGSTLEQNTEKLRQLNNLPPATHPSNPIKPEAGRSTVHEVVAGRLSELTKCYESALKRRRIGSAIAWTFVIFGLLFFGSSVVLLWAQWNKAAEAVSSDKLQSNKASFNVAIANANSASGNAATASITCGVLLEFVALAIFYSYGKNLTDLQDQLDTNNRLLLAILISEGMGGETREKAQGKLVEALSDYRLKDQDKQDSKEAAETGAVNNTFSINQSPAAPKQGD